MTANPVLQALAARRGSVVASGSRGRWLGAEFLDAVHDTAAVLQAARIRRLALAADNGPEWLIVDLAARAAGAALVPLPGFFTAAQREHVLELASVQAVAGAPGVLPGFETAGRLPCGLDLQQRERDAAPLPHGTAKITFTSGTTGQPKGVCLSDAAQDGVATALARVTASLPLRRHLCALPLAVLLENVAGAWTALLRGSEVVLPPLATIGWTGSSRLDAAALIRCVEDCGADSLIVLPQMLKDLVQFLEQQRRTLHGLGFVAVGGARTAPALLERARRLGLPVYEGYGLSECGSVVCLNLPDADRPGSVGRPLPGRILRVQADGRIQIRHPGFLGYAGEPPCTLDWLDSGDLGTIDDNGYVHIQGRSKNLLITGYGRNVAPEWVESELLAEPGILQAVVVGEGEPALGALIVAADGADPAAAVTRCNARLPDYARIGRWHRIGPLTAADGFLTANGRPRRQQVLDSYRSSIEAMSSWSPSECTQPRHPH